MFQHFFLDKKLLCSIEHNSFFYSEIKDYALIAGAETATGNTSDTAKSNGKL